MLISPDQLFNKYRPVQPAYTMMQSQTIGQLIHPSMLTDRTSFSSALSAPSQLMPSGNLNLLSPSQQVMDLGRRYGVPHSGQDMQKYQKDVAKAILNAKARQYGVPLQVAYGIAGNESNWTMWKNINTGETTQGRNVRDGVLKSTDWGVMQINDKAHTKAFPRAKYDMEYNIDYGLKYLARQRQSIRGSLGLGFGDWDRTIASYNLGHNPSSERSYEIAQRYVSHVHQRSGLA